MQVFTVILAYCKDASWWVGLGQDVLYYNLLSVLQPNKLQPNSLDQEGGRP